MTNWGISLFVAMILIYTINQSRLYIAVDYRLNKGASLIDVKVYLLKKILLYNMQIPDINEIILKPNKKAEKIIVPFHNGREKRFTKKSLKYYSNHPERLFQIVREIKRYFRIYDRITTEFTKLSKCEYLHWKTIYGSPDASLTAITVGSLWSFKKLLIESLKKRIHINVPLNITVIPVFDSQTLEIDFSCIFSIKVGNVISALKNAILYKEAGA